MLSADLSEFLTYCRAADLSPKTVAWYHDLLGHWSDYIGPRDYCDPRLTRAFIAELSERPDRYVSHPKRRPTPGPLSAFTLRAYARAIRRFFNWAFAEGLIETNPARRIPLPRKPKQLPKAIAESDFEQMLSACQCTRDRALLLVLRDTGCRSSEVAGLRMQDVDLDQGIAQVKGKGDKERSVFLSPGTVEDIRAWLLERGQVLPQAPLFETTRGPITRDTIYQVCVRCARRAGVTARFNPHAFRHAFGRDWVLSDGDLSSLAAVLGHESVETTQVYSKLKTAELQAMHDRHGPLGKKHD